MIERPGAKFIELIGAWNGIARDKIVFSSKRFKYPLMSDFDCEFDQ